MYPWAVLRQRRVFSPDDAIGTSNVNPSQNTNDVNSNNQDNVDDPLDLWLNNDEEDTNPVENDANNNNVQQQQQQTAAQTAQEAINAHLDSLGFTADLNPQTLLQELQEGNTESLANAMTSVGKQAYQFALQNLIPVMNRKIEEGIEQAVAKSRGVMNSRDAVSLLEQSIPSMANPAIAPIGKAVMAQALKKHKGDIPAAIKTTKQYLSAFTKETMPDLDLDPPPRTPGNSGRPNGSGGNRRNNTKQSDEIDWQDVFNS